MAKPQFTERGPILILSQFKVHGRDSAARQQHNDGEDIPARDQQGAQGGLPRPHRAGQVNTWTAESFMLRIQVSLTSASDRMLKISRESYKLLR